MATDTDPGDIMLGLGVEFLMLGLATGVASISDDIGSMMVVFMAGLMLVWLMYHTTTTNALPNLMKYLQQKGVLG
jgi:hypothetical protein